jgi:hypothetical protein
MSGHMQIMQALQGMKMNQYHKNVGSPFRTTALTRDFEQNVLKDQARSVFLVANARLLTKAKPLA